ncbi:hypothetical protein KC19_VG119100 [Ceratodon purpureus]|uniref:Uncharacterized protein n=1 Tax=Ceratodon purpureus TaxID=3225 RepID=A0A8T0HPI2_CERPU|nr:hypothetical protein KC19_VG119100 [Ceratodon purpureus]
MLEYESRLTLYKFLNVLDLPNVHWCDNSCRVMASYIYRVVIEEIKNLIRDASFIVVTIDEVTSIENGSYLPVHYYTVNDWVRVLHVISLRKVDCASIAANLTKLVVEAVKTEGGLNPGQIASKLLTFGADIASALEDWRLEATTHISEEHAPFCIDVHCVANRCNLALRALLTQPIFGAIEQVLGQTYSTSVRAQEIFRA